MSTVAIVQARMTSTRLPGKVMADFCNRPMLGYMLDRVRRASKVDDVWVATTRNASDDAVAQYCGDQGIAVFRGDEFDVLGRYAETAVAAGAGVVVRLTADCPFSDPALIDQAIGLFKDSEVDYCGNAVERTYPDGLDVEVMSGAALKRCAAEAVDPFDREHVTPYASGLRQEIGGAGFRRAVMRFQADFSHVRWTVDTAEDLERARILAATVPEDAGWLQFLAYATRRPVLLGVDI